MSINFLTFGSHDNYIDAAKRLEQQAKDLNIFNNIHLYTGESLKNETHFWNTHQDFISNNKRGYGYWLWKPYLIKKHMDLLNDGDILLFLDCGCEIDIREKFWIYECIEKVKTYKIVGTFTSIERDWNKMDLIDKLQMNNDSFLNTDQRQGGVNLFLICNETRKLVNEWYDLACDYHNIDDSPSILTNLPSFKEHRHDQSIFSLLTKKYNLYCLNDSLSSYCIVPSRNKSGISRLKY